MSTGIKRWWGSCADCGVRAVVERDADLPDTSEWAEPISFCPVCGSALFDWEGGEADTMLEEEQRKLKAAGLHGAVEALNAAVFEMNDHKDAELLVQHIDQLQGRGA